MASKSSQKQVVDRKKTVSIVLTDETVRYLHAIAVDSGTSRSHVVRMLIKEHYSNRVNGKRKEC